jgi:hypothetical protein
LKDLEGCPVIKIIRLDGSSGDNSDEKLVRSLTGNRIDGEIETVEVFVMVVSQGRDNPFSQRDDLLFTQVCHRSLAFHNPAYFIKPHRSKGDEPMDGSDFFNIALSNSLLNLDEIVPVKGFVPLLIGRTCVQ